MVYVESTNHFGKQVVESNYLVVVCFHSSFGISSQGFILVSSAKNIDTFPVELLASTFIVLPIIISEFIVSLVVVEFNAMDVVVVGSSSWVVTREQGVHLVVKHIRQFETLSPLCFPFLLNPKSRHRP